MSCNEYRNVYDYDYHTPAQWRHNSEREVAAAEKQQELAQRLTREADRLVGQSREVVIKNKQEVDYHSKVKVKDIKFKCSEIEKQKNDLDEEITLLLGYQTRIENANKSLVGDSLEVIAECLKHRNCREGIDLVFDDVEQELLRERQLIYGVNRQLEELLDKVVLQIRNLRSFVHNLTVDLRHKQNTLRIEAHNEQLNENSVEISVLNDKKVFKPAKISLTEWDRFTMDIIESANKVLVEGRPIRAFFDKCLSKMVEDLVAQSNAVNEAFRLRCDEYREVIDKLNKQRVDMAKHIDEVQSTVGKLRAAIDDKEAYIALVHTRLLNRTRREGVELCRDELEAKLCAEVTELEDNVRCLQGMLADSVACRRHLKQSAVRVDAQLEIKQKSLLIDGKLCREQRERINYQAY